MKVQVYTVTDWIPIFTGINQQKWHHTIHISLPYKWRNKYKTADIIKTNYLIRLGILYTETNKIIYRFNQHRTKLQKFSISINIFNKHISEKQTWEHMDYIQCTMYISANYINKLFSNNNVYKYNKQIQSK